MTLNEIDNYINFSSQKSVCIFRNKLEHAPLLVTSFYIMGGPLTYILSVEFDPIDMIDNGEGWVWHSVPMELEKLVSLLEEHFNLPIDKWENVTQSGRLSFFDGEIDSSLYFEHEEMFIDTLLLGKTLLPEGISWQEKPK